jgi:sigma-B regulation protein RsbU (phosphoserine phosphatase)
MSVRPYEALAAGSPPLASEPVQVRILALLAELSQSLAVTVDIEETLARAVRRIAECMHAEAASLFLLDASGEFLECRACHGPVDVRGLKLAKTAGICGRAFDSGACQMVRDAHHDPDFAGRIDARTGFNTRSVLCTPLTTTSGPIGVLQVLNKQDGGLFDDADRDMLRVLAAPTALAVSNAQLVQALMEQNRIKRELQLARRMQRSLLPKRRRDQFPVIGINRPAREISGDWFDHFELPDGRVGFAIGDVSGKGLDAAMLMVRTASLLRWAGKDALPPDRWLARINDELCETISGGTFVCAVVGYYDPRTHRAEWANAGFPPALVRHAGGRYESFLAEGPPLAIVPGTAYPTQSADLADASLYFYSDGVTDVRDAERRTIGTEGVRDLFKRHAEAAPEARLSAIITELRRMRLADDTTILLVERPRGAGTAAEAPA